MTRCRSLCTSWRAIFFISSACSLYTSISSFSYYISSLASCHSTLYFLAFSYSFFTLASLSCIFRSCSSRYLFCYLRLVFSCSVRIAMHS